MQLHISKCSSKTKLKKILIIPKCTEAHSYTSPHKQCGVQSCISGFAVPTCMPLPWQMLLLPIQACPCCSLQTLCICRGETPAGHTLGSLLAAPCWPPMVSWGRIFILSWTGWRYYGTASGSTKTVFFCFSSSVCQSD